MACKKEQLDVAEPFKGFWYLKCSTCELMTHFDWLKLAYVWVLRNVQRLLASDIRPGFCKDRNMWALLGLGSI